MPSKLQKILDRYEVIDWGWDERGWYFAVYYRNGKLKTMAGNTQYERRRW